MCLSKRTFGVFLSKLKLLSYDAEKQSRGYTDCDSVRAVMGNQFVREGRDRSKAIEEEELEAQGN